MLGLRKAAPADLARARGSVRVLEISAAFGVWARLAVLTAGLWLAIDAWSWQGWIIAGLVGWTALVLLGDPLTGKGLRAMAAEAKPPTAPSRPACSPGFTTPGCGRRY